MKQKVYAATVLIFVDEQEAIQEGQRDADAGPLTIEELSEYLMDAVHLDLDVENNSNPCGVGSIDIDWGTLHHKLKRDEKRWFVPRSD